MHNLGDGGSGEIFGVELAVGGVEGGEVGGIELFQRVDLRAILLVGNNAVVRRIVAGRRPRR